MKPDPIFALIENARKRDAEFALLVDEYSVIESSLMALGLRPSQEDKQPLMVDHRRRYNRAESAASKAMRAVCSTRPTTMEGLLAMLEYLRPLLTDTMRGEFADGRTDKFPETLIATVKAFARPSLRIAA